MHWCRNCKKQYSDQSDYCPVCNSELQDVTDLKNELLDSLQPYSFKEDFTMEDLVNDLDETDIKPISAKRYKGAREYYADARSKSFAFFLIGIFGLTATILSIAGVINLQLPGFSLYVMLGVFLGFINVGIYSLRKSRSYLQKIKEEDSIIKSVKTWYFHTGINHELLSSFDGAMSGISVKELYLKKYEIVRSLLKKQFADIDPALLDQLASEFCDDVLNP